MITELNTLVQKAIVAFANEISQFDDVKTLDGLKLFVYGEANEPWIQIEKELENLSDEFEAVETKSSDIAFLSYTSGTTGNPKGVVHTHSWGYAHLRTTAEHWLGVKENDISMGDCSSRLAKMDLEPILSGIR